MYTYKIIFNKNGTSLEIAADRYIIEDNIVSFMDVNRYDPIAVFNMDNIIGFKILETV